MPQRPSIHKRPRQSARTLRPSIANKRPSLNSQSSLSHTLKALFLKPQELTTSPQNQNSSSFFDRIPLSRRGFILGAGLFGLIVAGSTGFGLSSKKSQANEDPTVLHVAQDKVFTRKDCRDLEARNFVSLERTLDLPSGSLLFSNDDQMACCLIPHEQPGRLMKIAALDLVSGQTNPLIDSSLGHDEGYEIYDARISDKAILWVEAHTSTENWRLYTRPLLGGQALLLDEGDHLREMPSLALIHEWAFWQSQSSSTLKQKSGKNYLNRHHVEQGKTETLINSNRRFACPLYADNDGVVTAFVSPESGSYQLTYIEASSAAIKDELKLPAGMTPQEIGYGPYGFSFSFESIYNFGAGISNLGTYTPAQAHPEKNYQDLEWFRFDSTPYAPVAWCGKLLVVKGRFILSGIDLQQKGVFPFESENSADTWGEYLASTGQLNRIVSYCSIPQAQKKSERKTRVRIWSRSNQDAANHSSTPEPPSENE